MKELILKFPDEIEVDFENSDLAQGLILLKLSGSEPIKIRDCDFSVRLYNGLLNYFIIYLSFNGSWGEIHSYVANLPISELSKISLNEFYKIRNVGRKSSIELIKFCSDKGITLQP